MQEIASHVQPLPWASKAFIPIPPEAYSHIQQFLIYEALLLDYGCFDRWSALLASNITYSVFNRSHSRDDRNLPAELAVSSREALLARLGISAPAVSAPPCCGHSIQTRRTVTNVCASFADCKSEFEVVSHVRVASAAPADSAAFIWSGERRDRLRARHGAYLFMRRELLIDCVQPGAPPTTRFI
jgi:hypothetical protein